MAGDGLVDLDIDPRRLQYDLGRNRRDWIPIGVAARDDPAAHEVLVEAFGRLARREAAIVAPGLPVAAAVGRVDLVREHDAPVPVEAELVLGIGEDEAVLVGDGAAPREESERSRRYLLPLCRREQPALQD